MLHAVRDLSTFLVTAGAVPDDLSLLIRIFMCIFELPPTFRARVGTLGTNESTVQPAVSQLELPPLPCDRFFSSGRPKGVLGFCASATSHFRSW
jgi:hypothetical protein